MIPKIQNINYLKEDLKDNKNNIKIKACKTVNKLKRSRFYLNFLDIL